MFSLIYAVLAYKLLRANNKVEANGLIIAIPIIADCVLIIEVASIIFK